MTAEFTLALLVMVVLGGAGTRRGAVTGGVLDTYLDKRLLQVASSDLVRGLPDVVRVPASEPLSVLGILFVLVLFSRRSRRDRPLPAVAKTAGWCRCRDGGPLVTQQTTAVPVSGGNLEVHHLGADPGDAVPAVVALHGITANALAWTAVGRALEGRVRLVAPDLRGRAGSRALPPGKGLGTHVDDVVALLDHLGLDRVVVAGHSMGGFVAALLAARHPERVSSVVLVDGGVGFPAPPGTDVDAVLEAVIGPAMRRLSMRFGSRDEHLDFWRQHPALGPVFGTAAEPELVAYLDHDLQPDGDGAFRSSCSLEAVRRDGADVVGGAEVLEAVRVGASPTTLLWAPRGLLDEPQGLYDEGRIAAAMLPPSVDVRRVDGTNHYTVLLAPDGVGAVAGAVEEAVARGADR